MTEQLGRGAATLYRHNEDPFMAGRTDLQSNTEPWSSAANTDPFATGSFIPPSPEVTRYADRVGDNSPTAGGAESLRTAWDSPSAAGYDPFAVGRVPEETVLPAAERQGMGERLRALTGNMGARAVELSGLLARAGNVVGKFMPGSRLHNGVAAAGNYMETAGTMASGAGNVYDAAQSAYNNRGQVLNSAFEYGKGAGVRVAGAGAQAALDVLKKRTGVSVERGEDGQDRLKVRKLKLARFVLKVIASGGAYGAKVAVEAGLKARRSAVKGARSEYAAAKQAGVNMARDAFSGNNPLAYNVVPEHNPNNPQSAW